MTARQARNNRKRHSETALTSKLDFGEAMIDGIQIEGVGIETATAPFEHLLMFFVRRVVDGFEEVDVSRTTADVLWRTCVTASQRRGLAN